MTEKQDTQTKNDIKNSVMTKIEGQTPVSKKWYQLVNWTRIITSLGLAILAGSLLGFYLWDLAENLKLASGIDLGLVIIINSFVELLLITGLISWLLYFLYRQTDWFLVSYRFGLFFGIWAIILIISGIFLTISRNSPEVNQLVEDTKTETNNLPFRQRRLENILQRQKENGVIVGRVSKITTVSPTIIELEIENLREKNLVQIETSKAEKIQTGDFVRVKLDKNNPSKALEINKIRRPRGSLR